MTTDSAALGGHRAADLHSKEAVRQQLLVGGSWRDAADGATSGVVNAYAGRTVLAQAAATLDHDGRGCGRSPSGVVSRAPCGAKRSPDK